MAFRRIAPFVGAAFAGLVALAAAGAVVAAPVEKTKAAATKTIKKPVKKAVKAATHPAKKPAVPKTAIKTAPKAAAKTTAKKTTAKKTVAKKTVAKKLVAKKPAAKKTVVKKAATKTATKPSATAHKTHKTAAKTTPVVKNVPLPPKRPAQADRPPVVTRLPAPQPRTRPLRAAATPLVSPLVPSSGVLAPPMDLGPLATAYAAPTPSPATLTPEPLTQAPPTPTSAEDLAAVREAIALIRRNKTEAADALAKKIKDPVAAKVVEWLFLRSDSDDGMSFDRFHAFVRANPHWPNVDVVRKRAEVALWNDKRDPATVLAFFAVNKPSLAKGRLALARALLARGDRAGAQIQVREAWRMDRMTDSLEDAVVAEFGALLTPGDTRARMDHRLFESDYAGGLRAAKRLGATETAIAKARIAVEERDDDAKALLNAVPEAARRDSSYIYARARWLRREEKPIDAAVLILSAPRDQAATVDADEWWVERRVLVRDLLDKGDAVTAYRIASEAVPPHKRAYRTDYEFTAGWIALRYLNKPDRAMAHFARIPTGTQNPTALSRAFYWQGRAAEALRKQTEAVAFYRQAAHYTTTYYGQLARARLGETQIALRTPPHVTPIQRAALSNSEALRAIEILYAINERDLILPMVEDLARNANDVALLTMLGEVVTRHNDARAMVLLGRLVLNRGHHFDVVAYPHVGVPAYQPLGPAVDRSIIYSVVRQESAFNPKVVSVAHALGLMQVTPDAGRDVARKYKIRFDKNKLLTDPAYNCRMGAAEIAGLLSDYHGNLVLTFAAYNAGRGRIRQWIARFGDPRDRDIDPIDWVERIPFSETRNYVQRLLENVQLYRARFAGKTRLLIEADLRRGATAN